MPKAKKYWKTTGGRLGQLALNIVSVPATSAPVGRVLSSGGLLCAPHQSSLADETLSKLIVLKCNKV